MKHTLKIIFDATPMVANKTGVAYYTERLALALASEFPDDVELVGFYYNFLGRRDTSHLPRLPNLRYMGASVIPSKIVFQLRRWGIEVPIELLALQKGDFVLYANFLSYPSLLRTPSAPVIHDLTYLDLPDYVSPKLRHDLVRFVPKAIKRAKFVITVSEFSKQRIANVYDVAPSDILVTPIPPLPPVVIAESKKRTVLKKYGLTKPFILFVGTIEPRKNILGLAEAYLRLPKRLRDAYDLVLVGRIERFAHAEAAQLNAALQEGNGIIHLGYVTDEAKEILFQSATMFAHCSQYEGFGMPILEAMIHGVPCAISDIPVFKEVAGDAALYFDWRKPDEAAAAMQKLLESPSLRQKLSALSLERAQSYRWNDVARSLYTMIKHKTGRS